MRLNRTGTDWARLNRVYCENSEMLAHVLGPILGNAVRGGASEKSAKPDSEGGLGYVPKHPSEVGKEFRAALGDKKFFHGNQPGHVDLSFYGMLGAHE